MNEKSACKISRSARSDEMILLNIGRMIGSFCSGRRISPLCSKGTERCNESNRDGLLVLLPTTGGFGLENAAIRAFRMSSLDNISTMNNLNLVEVFKMQNEEVGNKVLI